MLGGGSAMVLGMGSLPLVDITALRERTSGAHAVAARLDAACRRYGFFVVTGHGIEPAAFAGMREVARRFFALPEAAKSAVSMSRGGRAWRGWFPVFGELTSGIADHKEGLYLGVELPADDPRVRAGVPLHGANLFPEHPAELRATTLEWIERVTALGHVLMEGLAIGLGLPDQWFRQHLTGDPTVLFRMFHYPPGAPGTSGPPGAPGTSGPPSAPGTWGVGEHTDYGLLTLLAQDDVGGLEVKTPEGWLEAPALEDAFVCNLGDMLDRLTAGRYRSTPHRVRNSSERGRLSFPLFFDPSWTARVPTLPLEGIPPAEDPARRWDGADLQAFPGTYGEYLTAKVARVFPALFEQTVTRR
jgi:isopenicillin N synthase-like dioxygenase